MDSTRTNDLIDRYWAGQTTLAEEQELRQFFNQFAGQWPEDWPPTWRSAAQALAHFATEADQATLPDAFDAKLKATLQARTEEGRAPLPLTTLSTIPHPAPAWWRPLLRTAAGLVLVGAAAWYAYRLPHPPVRVDADQALRSAQADTYQDPQRAYEATRRALRLVSLQLNKGKTYAGEIKRFHEAENLAKTTPNP